ncbi:MAG TPA: M2 family metallopeptidase [Anaerolineae bacterium]|nr:M2 family metallopeptidase [Anaerolineae bacterium]
MSDALSAFIQAYTTQVEPLYQALNVAYWNFTTTSDAAAEQAYTQLVTEARALHSDRARFEQLKQLRTSANGDELLARQATLIQNTFQANQLPRELIEQITALETEIQSEFNAFRAEINGQKVTDNQLKKVLREATASAEVRRAWAASKQIGVQVADRVRQLARLRNQGAHQSGFENYYGMSLALDELDQAELFNLFERLDELTRPLFVDYKAALDRQLAQRFHIPVEQLRPWHYGDPFFQEVPPDPALNLDAYFAGKDIVAITRRFFQIIGLPVDDVIERSDLYEREGKEQHAYCTDIDRRGDVRVLANVQPNEQWMATMLHECGHAVYDKFQDRSLPYLLRAPAHTLSTEAIAMLMGRLTTHPAWLVRYAGLTPAEAKQLGARLHAQLRDQLLIFTRWCLTLCNFERAIYRDPEQDLESLWWSLVEKYQMLRRPEQPPASAWAAKIHIGAAPVYYQNYLLGEMNCSQLTEYILSHVVRGDTDRFVSDPAVGRFLVERFFRIGARYPWNDALKHATAEPLKPEYFVKHLH